MVGSLKKTPYSGERIERSGGLGRYQLGCGGGSPEFAQQSRRSQYQTHEAGSPGIVQCINEN